MKAKHVPVLRAPRARRYAAERQLLLFAARSHLADIVLIDGAVRAGGRNLLRQPAANLRAGLDRF